MLSAEAENTIRVGNELCRQREHCREEHEQQRSSVAKLARLDQELAESLSLGLESITSMTGRVAKIGASLRQQLILRAELCQLNGQLAAMNRGDATEAERKAIEHAILSIEDWGDAALDGDARRFVSDCARRLEFVLQWLTDSLAEDNVDAARLFAEQACRLTAAMREIQDSWPWLDQEAMDESRRQYERGELMDFEAFKHELLKAAE